MILKRIRDNLVCSESKQASQYSLPSIGPWADPGVQAVSLQVTISHPPGSRLPLLSASPSVTRLLWTQCLVTSMGSLYILKENAFEDEWWRLDVLPLTQPTLSKQWRELESLTPAWKYPALSSSVFIHQGKSHRCSLCAVPGGWLCSNIYLHW